MNPFEEIRQTIQEILDSGFESVESFMSFNRAIFAYAHFNYDDKTSNEQMAKDLTKIVECWKKKYPKSYHRVVR